MKIKSFFATAIRVIKEWRRVITLVMCVIFIISIGLSLDSIQKSKDAIESSKVSMITARAVLSASPLATPLATTTLRIDYLATACAGWFSPGHVREVLREHQ